MQISKERGTAHHTKWFSFPYRNVYTIHVIHIFLCNLCCRYIWYLHILSLPHKQNTMQSIASEAFFSSINNDTFARGAGAGRSTLSTATSRKLRRCQRTRNVTIWGPGIEKWPFVPLDVWPTSRFNSML